MTLLSIESSTDSPTVERVLITMADYDEIFEKEHSDKFYALFTDKLEMFLKIDTVNDIVRKYGLYKSIRSIANRGFNVCSASVYDEPGWVIRKNSTTPENIRLQDEWFSFDASELMKKEILKGNKTAMNYKHLLTPKKVIFNGPATIVFWRDGTKTVVKCSENDKANPYNGFCAALAKKIFGNNSKIQKIVKNAEYQVPKECKDSCPIFETEGSVK